MHIRSISCIFAAALALLLASVNRHADAQPSVLQVGPGRELTLPSEAARIARNGDTIEIDAGVYEGDVAVWRQNDLTIRGAGGRAHLRANGAAAEGKAIWVIKGANTTVESVEFSGASVLHRNGAGIRQEGAGLTLRDCHFHHNENGILAGANAGSDIVVEYSEFAYNGFGDGYSHNLYIGTVRSFTLRFSYVHHAVVGHNVKSRALVNHIAYNRIMDESDGRSSYAIDLSDGGLSYVVGNLLQQGPAAENDAIVAYGAEGLRHPLNELHLINNTVVNDRPGGGRFVFAAAGTVRAVNNLFSGAGETWSGGTKVEERNNLSVPGTDFIAPAEFDYRLRDGAQGIARGTEPGHARGFDLHPAFEYVHKARGRKRNATAPIDAGALQYSR